MSADPHATEREQLLALKSVAEQALSADITLLKPHFADGFSIVTFSGRQFDDVGVFLREWDLSREAYLKGGSFEVKIDPQPAVFFGDVAICRGDSINRMTVGNGKTHEFSSPWTAVCRKQGGAWKILRAHSSIDPFRNSVVRSITIRLVTWVAIFAAALGFITGWLCAKVI
jgi:hypothetical protein